MCKGNIDFQSRSTSSTPCFREYKNIYVVLLPQENILTVQFHTGIIISHLISKSSNLELKSDRKKFCFLLFSMPVPSIS